MASGAADLELHRSIVQVLVSEYERGIPPRDIEGVSREVLACAWGFYAQVNRLARALLLLIDNGMGHETYILARVALEHTVLLHWVVERRDAGVAAVLASQSKRVSQTLNIVREAQMVFSPRIEREMREVTVSVNEAKAVGQFKTICKELNALELYFLYGVQSSFVHPSVATVNTFLDAEGNPVNQAQRRVHEVNLAVLAYCLIWANRDLDTLTPGHPRAEELERLARSIEVAPVLPPYRPVPPPAPSKKRGRGGRRRQ
jgi:hypothetical protein